ncbi:MAG: hypothetical protein WC760_06300 [Bacteroidia bacterium]|jgi:hypothetical protein
MIILNPGKLQNGQFIAHLHIEIPHTHGKLIFSKSQICSSRDQLDTIAQNWLSKWIRSELTKFVHQRENALQVAGYLPMNQKAFHIIIRQIIPYTKFNELCTAIDKHQNALRQILPHNDSPQSGWIRIIEEIIHSAHDHIHQQYNRSISRPTEQPNAPGLQMEH